VLIGAVVGWLLDRWLHISPKAAKLRRRREQVWQSPPCCAQLYTEILGKFGSNQAAEVRRIIEDHHRVRCERVKEPA